MLEKPQNRLTTRTSKHPYNTFNFSEHYHKFFTYSNNDPTFEFTLSLFLLFLMPLKCIFFILLCTDDRRLKDLFINLLKIQKTQIQKKANCRIFKDHLLQKTQIAVMHYFTRFNLNLSIHPFGYHGAIFYIVIHTKLFIAIFLK